MTLEEFEAICEKATPGPWVSKRGAIKIGNECDHTVSGPHAMLRGGVSCHQNDAQFIAACRTMVPRMIKALKDGKELVKHLDREKARWIESGYKSPLPEVRDGDLRSLRESLAELE